MTGERLFARFRGMGTDVRYVRKDGGSRRLRIQWSAVRLAFLALAVGLLLGILAPRLFASDSAPKPERTHVVAPGETLWQLAGRYAGEGDRRRFVHEAVRLNGLRGPNIFPGERLVVP